MIIAGKIFLLATYGLIAWQDFRFRAVSWSLFLVMGLLLLWLQGQMLGTELALIGGLFNVLLVTLVVLILFCYTRIIRNRKFINKAFGLGDLLFFYSFSLGYPSGTFIVLFSTSIIFALLIHLILRRRFTDPTVPLAGLMSVFLSGVILVDSFYDASQLYNI